MNLIERVKNMIITPKTEWEVVATEDPNPSKVVMGYVLPIAIVVAIAAFIGYGLIGTRILGFRFRSTELGLYSAISTLLSSILTVFITAFVVDALAPSFSSEKNFGRSVQLVAYGSTPGMVAGIFNILPSIALIFTIVGGIYGLYVIYLGMGPIKKTPEEKRALYLVICILALILVYVLLGVLIQAILRPAFGIGYPGMDVDF
jgi:hypothetical protein